MTDLRERIARAIYDNDYSGSSQDWRDDWWPKVRADGGYLEAADAVLAVLADNDAKVRAEALREAADAFEGGAINVQVFGDSPEAAYWRAVNKMRGSIVSSLRARADRVEQGEQA